MLNVHEVKYVYIACGPTDLRKSIDGLAMIVQEYFQLDPFQPALFVFCNHTVIVGRFSTRTIMVFGYTRTTKTQKISVA